MKEETVPTKQNGAVAETVQENENTREQTRTLVPPVDIFEIENGLAVVADLPGVSKEDVDVRVENDTLTIRGTATVEPVGDPVYREYDLVNYFRQFRLSDSVDQEKIEAELKYGVLTLKLPKAEKSKPKRVTVQVS